MSKDSSAPTKRSSATTTQAEVSSSESSVGNDSESSHKQQPLRKRAKKIAWRVTALYFWAWLGGLLIFGARTVESVQGSFADRFVELLSSIGFAPVNASALPFVFKTGWLLTITGFNPMQIVGLALYTLLAPILFCFRVLYRDAVKQTEPTPPGLVESRSSWSAVPLFTAAVVGWFVLYGAASSLRELAVGVLFSGSLLIIFTYRALQRTKPLTTLEVSVLGKLERFGASLPASIAKREQEAPTIKRSQAMGHLVTYGFFRNALLFLTLFLRGRRGKDRIYMCILLDYVLFLFMLGFAAIFFWALVAKTAVVPRPMTFSTAFYFSASHFLPGVAAPSLPSPVPLWAQIGPSLTAWVLFVLFVGPAASVVPVRQAAYGARLAVTYSVLRHGALFSSAYVRKMNRLKHSLSG